MWRLAWRNLWRNRTRTAITGSAIALSLALMLMSIAIGDSMHGEMMRGAVKTAGGHVLVHGDGYWETQATDRLIADPARVLEVVRGLPGVQTAIPRVRAMGLVSSSRGNSGVQLMGIVPEAEQELQNLAQYVHEGSFLGPDDAHGKPPIALGKGVVDDLGLELGDRVVITATDPSGEVTRALFRLGGIIETGSAMYDDSAACVRLADAQAALGLGDRVHQIGLVLDDHARRFAVRDAARASLGSSVAPSGGAHTGLELLVWDEAIPEMVGFIEMDDRFNYLFSAIIFLVVAFGIANTFMMAVLERIRELGLLAALGLTPGRIAALLLSETTLLAGASIALGLVIASGLHAWLSTHGIDMADLSNADFEISGVIVEDMLIKSAVVPYKWATTVAAVFGTVVACAAYPAWRATRVDPVEAMRTYE